MEQSKSYSEPSNFHFQLIFSVPIHSAKFVVTKLNYQGKIERWREKRYNRRILPKCRDVRKELWQWRLINPILGRRKLFFANYGDTHVGRPICLPFFKLKHWQQSFSVPSKFDPQHFQVKVIPFFFSAHKNLPFILHAISTFFSHTHQQLKSSSANNWQIYQINIIAQLPLTFLPFRKIITTYFAESLVYSPRRVTAEKAVQGFSEYKLVDYLANKLYSGARSDADQGEHHYCRKLKQWFFRLTVGKWKAF